MAWNWAPRFIATTAAAATLIALAEVPASAVTVPTVKAAAAAVKATAYADLVQRAER
jgi:hypothetical protein